MIFKAQIKEVKRLSKISNDTEYQVKLITEQSLKDLMDVQADELVSVEIKKDEWRKT